MGGGGNIPVPIHYKVEYLPFTANDTVSHEHCRLLWDSIHYERSEPSFSQFLTLKILSCLLLDTGTVALFFAQDYWAVLQGTLDISARNLEFKSNMICFLFFIYFSHFKRSPVYPLINKKMCQCSTVILYTNQNLSDCVTLEVIRMKHIQIYFINFCLFYHSINGDIIDNNEDTVEVNNDIISTAENTVIQEIRRLKNVLLHENKSINIADIPKDIMVDATTKISKEEINENYKQKTKDVNKYINTVNITSEKITYPGETVLVQTIKPKVDINNINSITTETSQEKDTVKIVNINIKDKNGVKVVSILELLNKTNSVPKDTVITENNGNIPQIYCPNGFDLTAENKCKPPEAENIISNKIFPSKSSFVGGCPSGYVRAADYSCQPAV